MYGGLLGAPSGLREEGGGEVKPGSYPLLLRGVPSTAGKQARPQAPRTRPRPLPAGTQASRVADICLLHACLTQWDKCT